MNRKTGWLGILLVLAVASCSGDEPGLADLRNGNGANQGGDTEGPVVVMGSSANGGFQESVLGIAVTDLSAGGSTTLTVQLQTADGAPYAEPVNVSFSSTCQSAGLSEIQDPEISTDTGTATTTYVSIGCSGTDTITARASVNGTQLTATGVVSVAPASLGSIEFVSADPTTIGLKGTGAAGIKETSILKFRVLNDVGGPVPDQEVAFELSTDVGGLSLTPQTAISGTDGTVNVTVRSGTIPTAVRVTATAVDTEISTQSSALTVSTAIADQGSFSLSAEVHNPEAWNRDGVIVPITVLAADRFNNFVPDNTAIVFTTELGAIVAQCLTVDGACTVNWRSQNPRTEIDNSPQDTGRTTIIAHAIGEETFLDADGDGVFDGGNECSTTPPAGADCFYDLPEAWRDDNEDGGRSDPSEPFVDFDSDGSYDATNGEWDGIVCGTDGTCTASLVSVRGSLVLVMARSFADILFFDGAGNAIAPGTVMNTGETIVTCLAGTGTFLPPNPATLADITQAQVMPAGTTVAFAASVGELAGKTDFVIPDSTSENPFCYSMTPSPSNPATGESGLFEVTVTSPEGNETYANLSLVD